MEKFQRPNLPQPSATLADVPMTQLCKVKSLIKLVITQQGLSTLRLSSLSLHSFLKNFHF